MNLISDNIFRLVIVPLGAIVFIAVGNAALNQQIEEIVSQDPSPTPKISPLSENIASTTPQPVSEPAVQGINTTTKNIVDSDPVINCTFPHTGTLRVTKSECAGTKIDCEIEPGKWQVVWKTDCDALRLSEKKSEVKLVQCVTSYGTHEVTKEFCDEFKKKDKAYSATTYPTYSPLPTTSSTPFKWEVRVNCYIGNQVIPNLLAEDCSKRLEQATADLKKSAEIQKEIDLSCRQAVDAWNIEKKRFMNDPENQKIYDSSAEVIKALIPYMQDIQASLDARGCTQTLSLY